MKINIASIGGFRYSISGSARNRKPRGNSILVGGLTVPHNLLKMTLMGGYGAWVGIGTNTVLLKDNIIIIALLQLVINLTFFHKCDAIWENPFMYKNSISTKQITSTFPVAHPKTAIREAFLFLSFILSIEKQQCAIFLSTEQEEIHTKTMP